jgi:hypothetical protein
MGVSIAMGGPTHGWFTREISIEMDYWGIFPISGNLHKIYNNGTRNSGDMTVYT